MSGKALVSPELALMITQTNEIVEIIQVKDLVCSVTIGFKFYLTNISLFFFSIVRSPITWITEYKYTEYFDNSMVPVCLTQAEKMWPATYFVLIILVFFILPLILLIVLYAIIAKNLMAEINNTNDNNMYNQRARRQVVTMLALVVLSFFLCLLPFRIITLWIVIIPDENVYSIKKLTLITYYKVLFISRILLYLNSAINPILYNIMSSKFRKGFKKLIGMRHVNNRKFTYTGTLTTTLNSSQQSSTRRLLMTQKSTPNFYNDENSFKNKNLYRQSTDSMLFDRRKNQNLQMLKNSGSYQARSKDIDELLRRTCKECGNTLEEFCKHCRRIVNKALLEQHSKAKKVCHCEASFDKTGKNNYFYCKNCEIFVNNRINKPKHSLDASLSTCSKLPINILIQTFDSFDSSPLLLKKFNDEKQKEMLKQGMHEFDDDTKEARQPLLDKCRGGNKPSVEPKCLSKDYDNLTDIEEENVSSLNQSLQDSQSVDDQLNISQANKEVRSNSDVECIELKDFNVNECEQTTYNVPKIPVTDADRKREKFSSILKTSKKKLVTKKSNVSFDLENLHRNTGGDIENLNKNSEHSPKRVVDRELDENSQQGRFSIRRTSTYDNVDPVIEPSEQESDLQSVLKSIDNLDQDVHDRTDWGSLQDIPSVEDEKDALGENIEDGLANHEVHSKVSIANGDTGTRIITQLPNTNSIGLTNKIGESLSIICDRNLPQHSATFNNCDSRSEPFDEIHKKIQSSIQILDSIAISCSSKEPSKRKDQSGCDLIEKVPRGKTRNLLRQQTLDSIDPVISTDIIDLIPDIPAVLEPTPVPESCDNNCQTLCHKKTQMLHDPCLETKMLETKVLPKLCKKSTANTSQLLPKNDHEKKSTNSHINYSHCNGRVNHSQHKELKQPKSAKPKFQSNIIKKMKTKKSYDDIRIEMKRRKSRKKPKLRRENSFDLGDLDLLKLPSAPDILVPFAYSSSENNVRDLITSQSKSTNSATNNVLINLFEMKDANEETFV